LSDPKHDDSSFRVIDRRLFNAEGEIRDEAVREERHQEESAPKAPASSAKGPAPATRIDAAPAAESKVAAPGVPAEEPKASRGFEMLVNFVAQNAAMLLGAYPDPRTGQPLLDLEGAREMIDMLDSLREATRNNLAAEDERLMLDVIGSLKLSYLEMTKAAARATQEQAKARR
jgi:hypothetical protein